MHWTELLLRTGPLGGIARRLGRAGHGQSTVEYALVGALVVIAAAAALTVLGEQVTSVFGNISNTLRGASH
jgi:Flp pilus assembly pilin Flp